MYIPVCSAIFAQISTVFIDIQIIFICLLDNFVKKHCLNYH